MVVEGRDVDWREPGAGRGVTGPSTAPTGRTWGRGCGAAGSERREGGPLGERDVELST